MALFLVIMIGLNMAQLSKDAKRCEKSNYTDKGCSIFKKAGMDNKK